MDKQNKIIFFGTPRFAEIILDILIKNNLIPIAVVTAPDKSAGRKKELISSPVKILSQQHKISVLQPINAKSADFIQQIKQLLPDLIIVVAYGQILPIELLTIPSSGALNMHPSLLPKYRGASPIQTAILHNEKTTGVSIMLMDKKMDHGPLLAQTKINLTLQITYPELTEQLARLGGDLLVRTLPNWLVKQIEPTPQDHSKATFTKLITKQDGQINWSLPAKQIMAMIRAYTPWPSAYTNWQGQKLTIWQASIFSTINNKEYLPGRIFLTDQQKLAISCGQNNLIIDELQLAGKNKMASMEFLRGRPQIIGSQLQ